MRAVVLALVGVLVVSAFSATSTATHPQCDPNEPCDPPPHPIFPANCGDEPPKSIKPLLFWLAACAVP